MGEWINVMGEWTNVMGEWINVMCEWTNVMGEWKIYGLVENVMLERLQRWLPKYNGRMITYIGYLVKCNMICRLCK